jgi:hypothetical protein
MLDRANRNAFPLFCYSGRPGDPLRSEEGLVVAVLEHAVGIFQRHALAPNRGRRRLFAEIEAWFTSDDSDYRFAFVSICQTLGLDVAYVRSGLRQWRESRQEALDGTPDIVHLPFRQPALHAVSYVRAVPALSGALRPARGSVTARALPVIPLHPRRRDNLAEFPHDPTIVGARASTNPDATQRLHHPKDSEKPDNDHHDHQGVDDLADLPVHRNVVVDEP